MCGMWTITSASRIKARPSATSIPILSQLSISVHRTTTALPYLRSRNQHTPAMSQPKPAIVIVTGAWHLPPSWDKVSSRLRAGGYAVRVPRLLSVCGPEPVDHTWRVDAAVVRDAAMPFVAQGREVVLVGHSYGGVVAMVAAEGLTVADRAARGLKGGVKAILFVCALLMTERGVSTMEAKGGYADWMAPGQPVFQGISYSFPVVPGKEPFYNDLPPEEAEYWIGKLQRQSQRAMEEPLPICLKDINVSMTYLFCEADQSIPIEDQRRLVAGVPGMKTEWCSAAHSPFLSQPDFTTDVIKKVAEEEVGLFEKSSA
ncbi:Alpha/beta hydrolase fold-1 [Camillea tinctor]|nr:Alpha/beta hydrolase fold-1 [Camillea tinctor]